MKIEIPKLIWHLDFFFFEMLYHAISYVRLRNIIIDIMQNKVKYCIMQFKKTKFGLKHLSLILLVTLYFAKRSRNIMN